MKTFTLIFATFCIAFVACNSKQEMKHGHAVTQSSTPQTDTVKKSIPKEVSDKIGDATISIVYHAPAVRGRTIWGGLVPHGEVWVTGAHQATSIEIDRNFRAGTKKIDAGKYALFTIPAEHNWKIIINRNWDQHLADEYSDKDDLVRVTVPVEEGLGLQERLYYDIVDYGGSKGAIVIRWEKIKVALPIEIVR